MLKLPKENTPSVETSNFKAADRIPAAQDSQKVRNAAHILVNQRTNGSI